MNTDKATPRPWRRRGRTKVIGKDGSPVAITDYTDLPDAVRRANAALIVRSVNAHDKLVESLAYIDSAAPSGDDAEQPDGGQSDDDLVEITITEKGLRDLRAALALVRGE